MKYIEMTITTTTEAEELVCDVLWNYTEGGVAVSSLKDVTALSLNGEQYDYIDEKLLKLQDGVSLVKGFFSLENAENTALCIRQELENLRVRSKDYMNVGSLESVLREIDGDDWIAVWKKHFRPFKVGKIVICPEWLTYNGSEPIVKIGTNNAFGTGEHETTSMCIEKLCQIDLTDKRVLDVGAGSGILGISAFLFNAKEVVMTEIDKPSCESCEVNIKLNNANCTLYNSGDLSLTSGLFDVVLANLTAEILCILAEQMCNKTSNNGVIITSGILKDRIAKVENAFSKFGFLPNDKKVVNEWCSITFMRNN